MFRSAWNLEQQECFTIPQNDSWRLIDKRNISTTFFLKEFLRNAAMNNIWKKNLWKKLSPLWIIWNIVENNINHNLK